VAQKAKEFPSHGMDKKWDSMTRALHLDPQHSSDEKIYAGLQRSSGDKRRNVGQLNGLFSLLLPFSKPQL
jgi:hypothetical protein